ncbi:Tfx family DNA-binding protein [Methanolacinia petrolearia]|uniref:Tfx family DNA-binding protein n=1 Tax=Methanolacinia petrolearia TaxID=54120 RepID=UPI003BAB0494
MKDTLLTDRQKEVLRYRKQGLTQQQIADIIHTSKANICTVEKAAMENIKKARETLDFLYTLDTTHLCTIEKGMDSLDAVKKIFAEAEKPGIKIQYDTISLINKMRESNPEKFRGRYIKEDLEIYINEDGDIFIS